MNLCLRKNEFVYDGNPIVSSLLTDFPNQLSNSVRDFRIDVRKAISMDRWQLDRRAHIANLQHIVKQGEVFVFFRGNLRLYFEF